MDDGFGQLKITRQFLNALGDQGISEPTLIQTKAIPPILAGQDVIGIAPTGTGKSIAFLLPIAIKVKYAQGTEPRAVILVPTKELCVQVAAHLSALCAYTDLRTMAVYGGVGPKDQLAMLKEGIDILVATPGRFMELYLEGGLPTKKIKTLVLDEADRMMEMGFMGQIRDVLEVIPVKRQNLLFSATFPERVEKLAHEFLEFPTRIEVAPQSTAVETIDQQLYYLPNFRTKLALAERLLNNETTFSRVLLFTRTKQMAEDTFKYLDRKFAGQCRVIHSNKGQNSRLNAIQDFGSGRVRILVATDVAARGLDILLVSHVINLSVPVHYEDYVHRIGRTGRAFNAGTALTFCDPSEKYHIKKIEKLIREPIPLHDLPESFRTLDPFPGEMKAIAMEIDRQKKLEDPEYQGAFHERKKKKTGKSEKTTNAKRKK